MFCLASKCHEVHVFAEICLPHAMQIRQTGGPEVLNWTAVDVDVAADMQGAGSGLSAEKVKRVERRLLIKDTSLSWPPLLLRALGRFRLLL